MEEDSLLVRLPGHSTREIARLGARVAFPNQQSWVFRDVEWRL